MSKITIDPLYEGLARDVAFADGGMQGVEVRIAHRRSDSDECGRALQLLDR